MTRGRDLALTAIVVPESEQQCASMPHLDWSKCPVVESVPGKVSGAWVLKGTRIPVSAIFESIEAGPSIDDILQWFDGLDRTQIEAVLEFVARSLDRTPERNHPFAEMKNDNDQSPNSANATSEIDEDEQFYRDTESEAFPKLDDGQLAMLEPLGTRRVVRRGELVTKAGQRNIGLTAVLRGELEVFESRDGQEQILATSGPRGFLGDVAQLMGTAALANSRGKAEESEILQVPADRLRQALAELPGVGEPIVKAFIMRRQRLMRDRDFAGLRILAPNHSRDGAQLDDFLDKNHVPHRFIDFQTEGGRALAKRLRLASRDLPALITANGMPLRHPSLREVARVAGLLKPLEFLKNEEIFISDSKEAGVKASVAEPAQVPADARKKGFLDMLKG